MTHRSLHMVYKIMTLRYAMLQYAMLCYAILWCDVVWCGIAWQLAWHMVWFGLACHAMPWHGMVRYGTVRYGTVLYGTLRYGMVWYGMVVNISVSDKHFDTYSLCVVCRVSSSKRTCLKVKIVKKLRSWLALLHRQAYIFINNTTNIYLTKCMSVILETSLGHVLQFITCIKDDS